MKLYNDDELNKLERLLATIYFWFTSESNGVLDDTITAVLWAVVLCILLVMATYW